MGSAIDVVISVHHDLWGKLKPKVKAINYQHHILIMIRVQGPKIVQCTTNLCHFIASLSPIIKSGSWISEDNGAKDCFAKIHIAFVCRYKDMEEARILGRCNVI